MNHKFGLEIAIKLIRANFDSSPANGFPEKVMYGIAQKTVVKT